MATDTCQASFALSLSVGGVFESVGVSLLMPLLPDTDGGRPNWKDEILYKIIKDCFWGTGVCRK